jgi:hypothetical protein
MTHVLYPHPDNAFQLSKLRAEQLIREAETERMLREARSAMPHPASRLISPVRGAFAAVAHLIRGRTPSPEEQVEIPQTTGSGFGTPAANPAGH